MSVFARQALSATRSVARTRSFSSTVAARKDLVQDLYVREIKAYKAPVTAKDAHVGSVKTYSTPSAPKPPTLPADLASELSAYDAAEPAKDAAPVSASSSGEQAGAGAEAYLSFLEQDLPKPEAHH